MLTQKSSDVGRSPSDVVIVNKHVMPNLQTLYMLFSNNETIFLNSLSKSSNDHLCGGSCLLYPKTSTETYFFKYNNRMCTIFQFALFPRKALHVFNVLCCNILKLTIFVHVLIQLVHVNRVYLYINIIFFVEICTYL